MRYRVMRTISEYIENNTSCNSLLCCNHDGIQPFTKHDEKSNMFSANEHEDEHEHSKTKQNNNL